MTEVPANSLVMEANINHVLMIRLITVGNMNLEVILLKSTTMFFVAIMFFLQNSLYSKV